MHDHEPEYAINLYREAINAGSLSPQAYLLSAKQWLNDNMSGSDDREGDGGPNVEHALADIRKALQLNPGSSAGYQLLGRAFFVSTKVSDDNIGELSPGVVSGENGATVRYYRALLYRRLGHLTEYEADLHNIAADSAVSNRLRGVAREELVRGALQQTAKEIDRLVKERRYDEADALIAQRLANPDNAPVEENYTKISAWVTEQRLLGEIQTAYDGRDWTKLDSLGAKYLEKFPYADAVTTVREMLDATPESSSSSAIPAAPAAAAR